jgi:spermidine/putrescine transport system permease protein
MRAKKWLAGYTFLLYSCLYIPLAVMVVFSVNNAQRNVVWKGFTLRWYMDLLRDGEILAALGMSLKLALVSSLLAAVLGLLASYVLVCHRKVKGQAIYDSGLAVPLMIPEVVFGVGLLTFFASIRFPLSFWSLLTAHVVFCLPYVVSSVKARLQSLRSSSLEEAAMDLGASEWQAFVRVTLPLARPAILAGALLAFTISFEDFVTSFFVAGVGNTTFPIKVYSMMKFGITPEVNALSTLLLVTTLGIFTLLHLFGADKAATRH